MLNILKNYLKRFTKQSRRVADWKRNGSEDLRYAYDLNEDSVVFDVGGYEGAWSERIFRQYRCHLYIFEPVKEYADAIKDKFSGQAKIKVFSHGLSGENKSIDLFLSQDGTSFYKKNAKKITAQAVKISDFLRQETVLKIDLLKLNIEGDEYGLLEDLIAHDLVKDIKNLQIQFHDFVPNAKERMRNIQKALSKTHHPTYQFEFVWENWEINPPEGR